MRFYFLISLNGQGSFLSTMKPVSDITSDFIEVRGFDISENNIELFRKNIVEYSEENFNEKAKIKYFLLKDICNIEKIVFNETVTNYVIVDEIGTKTWYLNNLMHRKTGPAKEAYDGHKEWYLNGQFHREGGPAIERINGGFAWYVKGKLHREDGPALFESGTYKYYINNQLHREDGPAIITSAGEKAWYRFGKLHCETGPAHITSTGEKYWYLNNVAYTESDFKRKIAERLL